MPKRARPRPIVLHPLPAQATWPLCFPIPQTQGTRGQRAGVGFALFCSLDSTSLLHHHFLPVPVGVQGLRERTDLCSYFHTSRVQRGWRFSAPTLAIPSFIPCLGESLCMFPLLWWEMFDWTPNPTLVSRGMGWWGHLFKKTFYYNKVYFHKIDAGLCLGQRLLRGVGHADDFGFMTSIPRSFP